MLVVKGQGNLTNHVLPCDGDISGMLSRNLLTFDTNIHLESRINSLDFGSQRSKSCHVFSECDMLSACGIPSNFDSEMN